MKSVVRFTLAVFAVATAGSALAQGAQKPHAAPAKYQQLPTYKVIGPGVEAPGLYGISAKDMPTLLMAVRLAGVKLRSAGDKTDTKLKEIQVLRPGKVLRPGAERRRFTFQGETANANSLKAFPIQEGDEIRVF